MLAALTAATPAVPVDSVAGRSAGFSDSLATSRRHSANLALVLSLALPGGGQLYNRQYWKAALIAPAELLLGGLALRQHRFAREARLRGDTTAYAFHRDWRTTWLWWTGSVVVFSMADAYVSAKLYGFDQQMRFADRPIYLRAGIGRVELGAGL